MARFRWHADYFDALQAGRCVRRSIIPADNAGEAEKVARAGMGACLRVEIRRVATAAPVRVIQVGRPQPAAPSPSPAGLLTFGRIATPTAFAG